MREGSLAAGRLRTVAAGAALGVLGAATVVVGPSPAGALASEPIDVPMVALGDARVVEGDAPRHVVKVPVTLSRPMDSTAYFLVSTIQGEKTASAGSDYRHVAKRVRVPAGVIHKTVGIPLYGDLEPEETEVVALEITRLDAPAASFSKPTGTVVIEDDDAVDGSGGPTVSASAVELFEGNDGPRKVQVSFTLSEPRSSDVFVTWRTQGATATVGEDFEKVSSRPARIRAGRTQKTVLVTVYGDDDVEADEELEVVLDDVAGGGGVAILRSPVALRLVDDDGDLDGDGLVDAAEHVYKTDPGSPDTDGDRLTDLDELVVTGTNPNQPDTDGDGLDDGAEIEVHGTDPKSADTDEDGYPDDVELAVGTDPLDPTDHPV